MRVLCQVQHLDVVELDVEVLIDRLQDSTDADVILELDGDGLVGEGLEEAVKGAVSAQIVDIALRNGLGLYLKKSMMAEVSPGRCGWRSEMKKCANVK